MLLTVTPNPSLDLLFEHDVLVWDDANRMDDPRRRPGGQGINVARACRALGGGAVAVALLGGRTGAEIVAALEGEGTPCEVVAAAGETRTFVAVREGATGRSMLLNARGPVRDARDADALFRRCTDLLHATSFRWVAGCGSLPRGFPTDFYARLAHAARASGARFVADCDGPALRAAAGAGCDLLVPNQHEAGRLLGEALGDVSDAARRLRERWRCEVAITLGADGAVLAHADGCFRARPPALAAGSAVGAGDAFLAALLLALEHGDPAALALQRATAAGSASLLSRGADLLTPADAAALFERTVVHPA